MFENSIFSSLELPCVSHPKQKVTHMCTQLECYHACLICQQCRQSADYAHHAHQLNLKPCVEGLNEISNLVEKDRLTMERLYRKTAGRKENEELIRWQQEKQRHYFSIQNHVNSMKYQLQQELSTIQRLFEKVLVDAKRAIIAQLDAYYKTYKQNFELFSRLIDPLVAFNRSHKYFSNVNNLILKLMTQTPREGSDWLSSLKSSLIFSQKMSNNANDFTQNLERGTSYMNSMVDSLPMIHNDEKKIEGILKGGIVESLRSMLRLTELRNLNNILNGETAAEFEKRRRQKA